MLDAVQEARPMKVLVWQWGRRGAGPLIAVHLTDALRTLPGTEAFLSLPTSAEVLNSREAPACALPLAGYSGVAGLVWRLLQTPLLAWKLAQKLRALRADVAICAMPGPLDLLLVAALRWRHVPFVVIVHDADRHPGEHYPFLMTVQHRLVRSAAAVVTLSQHVASRLTARSAIDRRRIFVLRLPALFFGPGPSGPRPGAPRVHGGPLRLLFFGRLLPYKGLSLLGAAVNALDCPGAWELRVVGSGPESNELAMLRATPGVTVENRWVSDAEIAALIAWADAVVLPYIEASQSGVAPGAIAAGRIVVATRVGGLTEQLSGHELARLCDPQPASLATALRQLLHECSGAAMPSADPREAWQEFASQLADKVLKPIFARDPKATYANRTQAAV
jgi:glycosyltransferase involved in cell wall biosynthesis